MLAYKKAIARLYDRRGKLALNWEGPYRVVDVVREGTYTLATAEGRQPLPRGRPRLQSLNLLEKVTNPIVHKGNWPTYIVDSVEQRHFDVLIQHNDDR
ncbi:hypothetical protein BHM03_00007278 [Ensete ventricosum]|uniref:Uncharacterized protein n=1 Tax=Ensete ventricosum TaxID=4639 RepID=A0A445MBZ5_ENSVE|nr:hypothetical protein BHM03_00007278 [Ensete ventricosum]